MTEHHDLPSRLRELADDVALDGNARGSVRQALERIQALESRERVLREALEPFAAEYEYWVKDVPPRLMLSDGEGTLSPADIPWDAIVRARAALAGDA